MSKKMSEIYESDSWSYYDYQPMIGSFGKIEIQVDDGDYQGDSRILYNENGKIGYLNFGWGSCSGCDSLQACGNLQDVQELADSLERSIRWFDSKNEALQFFNEHNWEHDYGWSDCGQKEFVELCKEYLSKGEMT